MTTIRSRLFLISIHALREEGDLVKVCRLCMRSGISLHALREEGDLMMLCSSVSAILFLSTPSARRATRHADNCCLVNAISIHARREEGDFHLYVIRKSLFAISIHALREEGDLC